MLGVIQPKPFFAVDQLLAEINGEPEAEAAEAEEPVESETEPAAEPEEAAEAVAEPVVVSFDLFETFFDYLFFTDKTQSKTVK